MDKVWTVSFPFITAPALQKFDTVIENDSKYYSLSGDIPVGGPSTWHVIDWGQRRVVSVTMDGEQDDESIAIEHFSRYSSHLSPEIHSIYVSNTGEIISTNSDSKNDETYCVHYPFLHDVFVLEGIKTVRRDQLEELERLGPDIDLVSYPPCQGISAKKVVFKYYFMWQYAHASWNEMNLWMRLPRHPNIVPFDRIVVDELEGRVVGFTNAYVPGGNLEDNASRIFKLEWLQQLIGVVDDLSLRYGIAHQDIAPRNILVDESTNSIMLIDFRLAARINHPSPVEDECYSEDRNDVKGVIFTVYEIITRDKSLRSKPHEEQNLDDLEKEEKWLKHPDVELDHPVALFRLMLQQWQHRRVKNLHIIQQSNFPQAIDLPSRPKPPPKTIRVWDANWQPCCRTTEAMYERRRDVRDRGGKVLNWERPPQRLLDNRIRVLSTGEIINC